jgi:hypothetical protein
MAVALLSTVLTGSTNGNCTISLSFSMIMTTITLNDSSHFSSAHLVAHALPTVWAMINLSFQQHLILPVSPARKWKLNPSPAGPRTHNATCFSEVANQKSTTPKQKDQMHERGENTPHKPQFLQHGTGLRTKTEAVSDVLRAEMWATSLMCAAAAPNTANRPVRYRISARLVPRTEHIHIATLLYHIHSSYDVVGAWAGWYEDGSTMYVLRRPYICIGRTQKGVNKARHSLPVPAQSSPRRHQIQAKSEVDADALLTGTGFGRLHSVSYHVRHFPRKPVSWPSRIPARTPRNTKLEWTVALISPLFPPNPKSRMPDRQCNHMLSLTPHFAGFVAVSENYP